jgi:radical SAM family protein
MLFSSLGILVTYKCNAMCDSCGPRCGPHRKEYLAIDEIKQLIDEATECGSKLICFTGGEPTLLGPRLEEVISYASNKGNMTRIVSNGWWAKNVDAAKKRMSSFMDAGLTEINISADDWHLPYVPLENLSHAVQAARDLGLRMMIAVAESTTSKINSKFLHSYLPGNPPVYKDGDDPSKITVAIHKAWLIPFGYASEKFSDDQIGATYCSDEMLPSVKDRGCTQILNAPAVLPDGRVTACCSVFNEDNHSLVMGYWPQQPLREILKVGEEDLLYNWIRFEGPYGIKEFIQKRAPEIKFRSGYAGICHLCGDLLGREDTRQFLQEHMHEMRDYLVNLKLARLSGINIPLGCFESRMAQAPMLPASGLTQISRCN